jgi:acetyl-CoA carboxylase carboxyltransferase component
MTTREEAERRAAAAIYEDDAARDAVSAAEEALEDAILRRKEARAELNRALGAVEAAKASEVKR